MGGNALKNVVTRRYARDEYFALKERILKKLQGHIDQFNVPKEFPCKESFGDIDVLMVCPPNVSIRNLIEELFNPNKISRNGDVYSFDFEEFQVDFILVSIEQYENAVVYFSYSDLGGLLGNICHKIGLKYGIQGLWMNTHTKEFDPTTASTTLVLSRNVKEIFDFLGYDYEKYMKGFDMENEFFQWIINGKYFRSFYFNDDQLNHAHRQRTSKRPIYIKFKAYLDQQVSLRNETNESSHDQNDLICNVREQALIFFNKKEDYHQGLNQRDAKRQVKEKYNGQYFCDIKDGTHMIKVHMKNFEKRFGNNDEEFHQWVLNTDRDIIKAEIEKYKNELKQNLSS